MTLNVPVGALYEVVQDVVGIGGGLVVAVLESLEALRIARRRTACVELALRIRLVHGALLQLQFSIKKHEQQQKQPKNKQTSTLRVAYHADAIDLAIGGISLQQILAT